MICEYLEDPTGDIICCITHGTLNEIIREY